MTMLTRRYRDHWIHCRTEGNRSECRIQAPDYSIVGRSRSFEGAKKKIRELSKKRGPSRKKGSSLLGSLRGASLTAVQREYITAFEEDVRLDPAAYKDYIRNNPVEWAKKLIDGLDSAEVRRLTREQRAETRRTKRLTGRK